MFVGELAAGLYSGSWAMLSDSFHLLLDTIAPLVTYISEFKFFGLSEERIKKTATVISISLFFIAAGVVTLEAWHRLKDPPVVSINKWFFIIALIGFFGNIYSFLVLKPYDDEKVSGLRKLLSKHMLVDAGGSVVVIISGISLLIWELPIIDPILSFILAILMIAAPFID